MTAQVYWTPTLFAFLRELRANNCREWFQANRERYEREVRDPVLAFIGDFAAPLRTISAAYIADPRPSGGSLFRIQRDIRFSKDKNPYKTEVLVQFRHVAGRDTPAPGFYLRLAPDDVAGAAGLYRPDSATTARIRDAIVQAPERWQQAVSGEAFTARCALMGEKLKRPPSGYAPNHPLIEDLKRKDFFAISRFTDAEACAPEFIERYAEACRAAAPLVHFLSAAVGLRG